MHHDIVPDIVGNNFTFPHRCRGLRCARSTFHLTLGNCTKLELTYAFEPVAAEVKNLDIIGLEKVRMHFPERLDRPSTARRFQTISIIAFALDHDHASHGS